MRKTAGRKSAHKRRKVASDSGGKDGENMLKESTQGETWADAARDGMQRDDWGEGWKKVLDAWHSREGSTGFQEPIKRRPVSEVCLNKR